MKTSNTKLPKSTSAGAIELLMQDHKAVKEIFKQYEKLTQNGDSDDEKSELVMRACNELTIHAQVEEEIFYPAVRAGIDDEDVMDEAEVEHAGAKDLIAQLESMEPNDALYDARFKVLGEYINHHVQEEENEMFPQAIKAKLDLVALGESMLQRKQELRAEMGLDDLEESDDDSEVARAPRSVGRRGASKR